jgi:diaminopimelate decarboxylase
VRRVTESAGVQARFAMKSCPATRILREMQANRIWIDAVSGNEVLRAIHAGYPGGNAPPQIMLTADVLRDNALQVIQEHGVLINIGSPGMVDDLKNAGYKGPIAIRINPGFGHGHVNACDTGGPSSKHGIWFTQAAATAERATRAGMGVVMLHAHIGSGPKMEELVTNLKKLTVEFRDLAGSFPDLDSFSLGGGIPHQYRESQPDVNISPLGPLFGDARRMLSEAAGRPLRLEIEPGRFFVASCATLVSRVADVKRTSTNEKGEGQTFVMVDAGFVDLVRPAMYGSYHRISVLGRDGNMTLSPVVVAGPLCESGDVFTRDSSDHVVPRELPLPSRGEFLLLHDAGAYGYAMSSNYNSIGRAPQVWVEEDGTTHLMSRRETVEDVLKAETDEPI